MIKLRAVWIINRIRLVKLRLRFGLEGIKGIKKKDALGKKASGAGELDA